VSCTLVVSISHFLFWKFQKGQGSGTTGTSNAGATQPSQAAQTTTQQSGPTSDSGTARARNTQPSAIASASVSVHFS